MSWQKESGKQYPWRNIEDPYRILISEFMLHRTRADQVVPVYVALIEKYPNLEDFCKGSINEKFQLMNSLGLRWRTVSMINALQEIQTIYGYIPMDEQKLMEIRGIGQYIANATICFATNKPMVLMDTNIIRVTGRYFGLNLEGEARKRKETRKAIETTVSKTEPRRFYYGIIDLAHALCKVKNPSCSECPLIGTDCSFEDTMFAGYNAEEDLI